MGDVKRRRRRPRGPDFGFQPFEDIQKNVESPWRIQEVEYQDQILPKPPMPYGSDVGAIPPGGFGTSVKGIADIIRQRHQGLIGMPIRKENLSPSPFGKGSELEMTYRPEEQEMSMWSAGPNFWTQTEDQFAQRFGSRDVVGTFERMGLTQPAVLNMQNTLRFMNTREAIGGRPGEYFRPRDTSGGLNPELYYQRGNYGPGMTAVSPARTRGRLSPPEWGGPPNVPGYSQALADSRLQSTAERMQVKVNEGIVKSVPTYTKLNVPKTYENPLGYRDVRSGFITGIDRTGRSYSPRYQASKMQGRTAQRKAMRNEKRGMKPLF